MSSSPINGTIQAFHSNVNEDVEVGARLFSVAPGEAPQIALGTQQSPSSIPPPTQETPTPSPSPITEEIEGVHHAREDDPSIQFRDGLRGTVHTPSSKKYPPRKHTQKNCTALTQTKSMRCLIMHLIL